MPADCHQCERPLPAHAAACPLCGATVVRNLANVSGLRRALQSVARPDRDTPPPTEWMERLDFQSLDADRQDTESSVRDRSADTDTSQPRPVEAARAPMPHIAGYSLERVIGRGGMGTVYVARQLSLDRPVAIKIMSRRWSDDPTFVARFTREAYAAARMTHPNLVQVYDIGDVDGTRYFSMEYVEGRSLAEIVRSSGKLDPDAAVGFILQAARGLKYAHDRGMIHRDVKPDNLLVDGQGIVKVADLGLVKTPDLTREFDRLATTEVSAGLQSLPLDMTGVRMALGTPAYMSPEQCRDAAAVDHRADIYSLGCSLYALLTGRQPFEGETAVELMTKHAFQPLTPPEEFAGRISKELSAVVQKMMAKHSGERYQSMGEVIRTLEQWLGVQHTGGRMVASEEQIAALEGFVDQFNLAPATQLRTRALTGFLSACVLGMLLLAVIGRLGWAFGLGGMILQSVAVYFVLNGVARKTYLFRRVRQFVVGLSVGDWLVAGAILGLFAILLWTMHLFWIWIGFGLIGAALAGALQLAFDRAAYAERYVPLAACEKLLRRLRVQGLEEDQLRQFVAKYAGRYWEEFFEALFGYEAKLDARAKLLRGESAGERERFAGWREPLIALIVRIERRRQATREREVFVRVEQARLTTEGLSSSVARRQAEANTDALLKQTDVVRSTESRRNGISATTLSGKPGTVPNLGTMLHTGPQTALSAPADPVRIAASLFLGAATRGIFGTLCVVTCILWAYQNDIVTAVAVETKPLAFAAIPAAWTAWIDTPNVGWAGVLLLISLLYTGRSMAGLVVVGSVVAVVAHRFGIPAVAPVQDYHVGLMLGTVIALVGYRFGRR